MHIGRKLVKKYLGHIGERTNENQKRKKNVKPNNTNETRHQTSMKYNVNMEADQRDTNYTVFI